jgi:hypothetical protein
MVRSQFSPGIFDGNDPRVDLLVIGLPLSSHEHIEVAVQRNESQMRPKSR